MSCVALGYFFRSESEVVETGLCCDLDAFVAVLSGGGGWLQWRRGGRCGVGALVLGGERERISLMAYVSKEGGREDRKVA